VKRHELDGEDIIHAKLYLLQRSSMTLDSHYNVEIYYLLNKTAHESPLKLSFENIDPTPGWKTFDITPIVLNWKQGLINHGLQVKLTKGGEMLPCEEVFFKVERDSMEKPSLVLFNQGHSPNPGFLKGGLTTNHVPTQQKRRRRNSNTSTVIQNQECHLKEMRVTSTSLSFGNIYVLSPKQFNAGKCDGYCKKIDNLHNSQSNNIITSYADVLSKHYYNTVGIQDAPSRCCVATSFDTLDMIFYNKVAKETILKKGIPAKATGCSCM